MYVFKEYMKTAWIKILLFINNLAHYIYLFFGYLRDLQHIFTFIDRHYISGFYNIPKRCHQISLLCMGIIILQSWGKVSVFVSRLEDVSGQWQCKVSVPWYHMCTCASFPMQGPELGVSRGRPEHRCFSWCHCWSRMSGCKVRRWCFAFPVAGRERCRRDKADDSDGTANGGVGQETDWCSPEKQPFSNHFWMYVSV